MKLDELKEGHLIEVVKLYEEHCGFGRNFRETMYRRPENILKELRELGRQEYRIGSRWDGHSKIYFDLDFNGDLTVRFNSNFDPKERKGKEYKEAEKAGQEFIKVAMQYINQQ